MIKQIKPKTNFSLFLVLLIPNVLFAMDIDRFLVSLEKKDLINSFLGLIVEKDRPDFNFKIQEVRPVELPWSNSMSQAKILFQDGGCEIAGNNESILTFGDSFLGAWKGKDIPEYFPKGICNSILIATKSGNGQFLTDSKQIGKQFIPLEGEETWERHRIWPGGGGFINNRYYVFFERVVLSENAWGFSNENFVGLMRSEKNSWKTWERVAISSRFPFKSPPFSVVSGKDGWLYCYFIDLTSPFSFVRTARVKPEEIENPKAYFVLPKAAADGIYGQVSVVWNEYLQCFVMAHIGSAIGDPKRIYFRYSRKAEGPFSPPQKVFEDREKFSHSDWSGMLYCPFLHPIYFSGDGKRMLLTYCRVKEKFGIPHAIEVTVDR
ncbi:MAG: DUF4185 domain-containing protein [Candidatus Riflebacteria bacterium]|nr:DUF4185 domain-containing protein [Candidatus Riflebacteria bacterium]